MAIRNTDHKKINSDRFFIVNMTFSWPENQCVSTPLTVFSFQVCCGKTIFSPFVIFFFFFTKTCFSIHITLSSVNFTWFALLSRQNFDDRLLFYLSSFWMASKQIFLWNYNNFYYKNDTEFIFIRKKFLTFFKKIPLSSWMTYIEGLIYRFSVFIEWPLSLNFVFTLMSVLLWFCNLTNGYWMRNNQNRGWKWNGNLYNINKIQ